MKSVHVLIVAATLFGFATRARAGLTLTIPSGPFYTADGTDTLDVTVTGDGITSFGAFTLSFTITPDASNATTPLETIQFVAPPSDPSLDPTLNSTNYVFFGNSADLSPPPSPFGTVSGINNTQLTVADSTVDFSDVTLANGATALLAQLVFAVPTNITNAGGDKFDVTLTDPSTALLSNNTGFDVPVSGSLTGVVTVEQPLSNGAVPEPGTFGMMLAGMASLAWLNRRRQRARRVV